ncbi:MAG: lpxK [Firmicutes bacterium]|nr:lpxK [Bacillota bacterium]
MRQFEAIQIYLYQLVHEKEHGIFGKLVLAVLQLFSWCYGAGVCCKLLLYRCGIFRQHRLPCTVISLGNITVGGTGKTPTAQVLAALIRDMGCRVVILNRGYRAKWREPIGLVSDGQRIYMSAAEAGDEAFLLAKNVPGVAVVVGKDRSLTGQYAVQKLNADVIILDDGYQHWQLARDLDIVLIDTLNGFGNHFLLPRGTLREPLENLNRAQLFLLTKVDQSPDNTRDQIREVLQRYNQTALIVESVHKPLRCIELEDWDKGLRAKAFTLETMHGKKVLAFSAIGNPSSFEQTLQHIGTTVAVSKRYPDHHDYTMAEMQAAMETAVQESVDALVTTEKDAVKIPAEFIYSDRPLPVYIIGIEVEITGGSREFMELVRTVSCKKNSSQTGGKQ